MARVLGAARLHDAEGDVAGAARDIEQGERPVALRRVERGDQRILPGAVQPAGHQVVHQVVAARDLVENVVDQPLLFGERHLLVAEMGVGRRRPGWPCGRNILCRRGP